ncbi:uncharacterized protein LOC106476900 [Limulus polyphemus]|uniref:Uncharacterized protein LOC106476900 n=1 Tax=Limulus polyphemus TaxID=6850 RepID=A0ABM1RY89_LIMPO|nr:uncharacterized protein LOC106476900 [Limulus polyphemus]
MFEVDSCELIIGVALVTIKGNNTQVIIRSPQFSTDTTLTKIRMKVLVAVLLVVVVVVYVSGHGPHHKMHEMLCESNDENVKTALKDCWQKATEFNNKFEQCKTTLSAISDEDLCTKWDEVSIV